jgi:hypothetical protein
MRVQIDSSNFAIAAWENLFQLILPKLRIPAGLSPEISILGFSTYL